MPRYSLNPDGSLKIVDESSSKLGAFTRVLRKVTKVLSSLLVISIIVIYGVVYYDNDDNEIIHSIINGYSSRLISCYNIGTISQGIDAELYYLENFGNKSMERVEDGVERIIDKIIEFREDASY